MFWMRASGSIAKLNVLASSCTRRLGGAVVEEDPAGRRLVGEHDVLGDGHHRDEHEVLVHHPDAVLRSRPAASAGDRLALDEDLALVRLVQAVDDVHQRRLAGAVLTEQRVHLAAAEIEVDAVVRDDAREALRDPAQLEDAAASAIPRDSMVANRRGGADAPPPRTRFLAAPRAWPEA